MTVKIGWLENGHTLHLVSVLEKLVVHVSDPRTASAVSV